MQISFPYLRAVGLPTCLGGNDQPDQVSLRIEQGRSGFTGPRYPRHWTRAQIEA